eukprot:g14601.t1
MSTMSRDRPDYNTPNPEPTPQQKLNKKLFCLMERERANKPELAKQLIEEKADVNYFRKESWLDRSVLMEAAFANEVECARVLIENKANLEAQCDDGKTALHWASCYGNIKVVKLLIESRADLNVVKLLIESRADLNKATKDGYTALHWTGVHGEQSVAAELVAAGANLTLKDTQGKTALDWAKQKNHEKTVKVLEAADKEVAAEKAAAGSEEQGA